MGRKLPTRNKPVCLHREYLASSRLFNIEQLDLRFSNGERRTYERISVQMHGAVLIVPMLDDDTFILVREYAAGTERYELAFPKGLIEAGETSLFAANRELMEEVGMAARQLEVVKTLTLAPGYFDASIDIVLAQDLYPQSSQGDEPEEIEVLTWSFSDLDSLVLREDFSEARSITALYMVKHLLDKRG